MKKILVLGGYGNFGKLICEYLSRWPDIELIIAGRSREKTDNFCKSLNADGAECQLTPLAIDICSECFPESLKEIHPDIVIHTCGPFQGQNYQVPEACMAAGSHYIDLADDRRFVCDFHQLNDPAVKNNVIAISGTSSVPGLSSVVVDHYAKEFSVLEKIDFAIVPGSNVELGEATLKGILSYIGCAFKSLEQGRWIDRFGWMDIRRMNMGRTLGTRWLANVDIPDLELFPARYPQIKTVRFQAGHELGVAHLSLAFMACLSRIGLIRHRDRYASAIFRTGQYVKKLGTDCGGMVIQLSGINHRHQQQKIIWRLIAKSGVGPRIPAIPAIILANRILEGEITGPGAYPCLGMFSLDEFLTIAGTWGIYPEEERIVG